MIEEPSRGFITVQFPGGHTAYMHQTDVEPVGEDEYYLAVQELEDENSDEVLGEDDLIDFEESWHSHKAQREEYIKDSIQSAFMDSEPEGDLQENQLGGQLSPFSGPEGESPDAVPEEPGTVSPLTLANKAELEEDYSKFQGTVRNKDMFVEAIGHEKGWSVAKAAEGVLEGKPLEMVEQHILETIRDYALAKSEEDLAQAIQKYLEAPQEQEMNEQRKEVFDYVFKLAEMVEEEGINQINEYNINYALKLIDGVGASKDYYWRPIITTLKEAKTAKDFRVASALGAKLRESMQQPVARFAYTPFGDFLNEDYVGDEPSTQFFGNVSNKDALIAQVHNKWGWSVAEQADDVISGAPMEELNSSALRHIFDIANQRGENELADAIAQYLGISFEPSRESPYKTGAQLSDKDFVNLVDQRFGWSVSQQAEDLLRGVDLEELNPNALTYIADYAATVGRDDIVDMLQAYVSNN